MNITYTDSSQASIFPWQVDTLFSVSELQTTEADELLCMIEQAAQALPQTQKLQALFAWATLVADRSEEPSHPAAKRAAALALVLERAIALAHAHARGTDRTPALMLSNTLKQALAHARNIVAKLKHRICPEMTSDPHACELSRVFTQQVTQSWFEGQFNPRLIELSQTEAQALNQYLYASEWMVRYTETQVGMSCAVWEEIADRLMQFPKEC
ncbi:NACHT C-terminal helical domain 2-containing protein [Leptolyngbya sp. AN03gr2]|uniref:NACHT C-terminal helical domain 2-containing protein n=1 Tax=unclassified Leptolyngbya TaxID=2650499 RepID=UPI003D31B7CC